MLVSLVLEEVSIAFQSEGIKISRSCRTQVILCRTNVFLN